MASVFSNTIYEDCDLPWGSTNKQPTTEDGTKSRFLVAVIVTLVVCFVLSIVAIICSFVPLGGKQVTEEIDSSKQIMNILMRLNETEERLEATVTREEVEMLKEENRRLLKMLNDTERKLGVLEAQVTESGMGDGGGSEYVRWGRKTCGNTSEQLYSGLVGGQFYTHDGGAAEYLCLPEEPEYTIGSSVGGANYIYGTEYQTPNNIFPQPMVHQNVPCARCYVPARSVTIMIPAKTTCPPSWTKKYEGYLMSGHYTQKRAYNYVCVDKAPESLDGLQADQNGALMYLVQVACTYLGHCPPYIAGRELACVVCSK